MTEIINSFPGYEFKEMEGYKGPQNVFRGEVLGFGGYIRSWPGIYENVALLDIQGLHPASIIAMNCFGEYTDRFKQIRDARIHIKHKEYDAVKKMFNGKLAKYLDDESTAKDLSNALKTSVNSVYGLTSANFDNPFRDRRNKNNIVALRGALFMKTLQDELSDRGFDIVAIKTDSVKIVNATKEIIDFCFDFAKKYGYEFDHEATYSRICQINDADYVALYADEDWCQKRYGYVPGDNQGHGGKWTATGKQFQVPYVFKSLFSHEPIIFEDKCITFQVKSALYLDMNEGLTQTPEAEKELAWRRKELHQPSEYIGYQDPTFATTSDKELEAIVDAGHNYIFVGRVGQFCPISPGCGGGVLLREQNGKYHAATGSKGYRWMESEMVRERGKEDDIDLKYFNKLVDDAHDNISKYGDFEAFVA